MPKVTVVTFVYNREDVLAETIQSILQQSYTDFEYLIVDDGSTDRTPEIISSFSDTRVRCIRLPENKGRPFARNAALDALAAANDSEYIAWMDGDDIAVPDRLEQQLNFLDANKEISILGSGMQLFQAECKYARLPAKHAVIKATALWLCSIAATTTCVRRADVERHALRYHEELLRAQDYAYVVDLLLGTPLQAANLPSSLVYYRARVRKHTPVYHTMAAYYVLKHLGFAEEVCTNLRIRVVHTILSLVSFEANEVLPQETPPVTGVDLVQWAEQLYHAVVKRGDIALNLFSRAIHHALNTLLPQADDAARALRLYTKLTVAHGHDLSPMVKSLAEGGRLRG